MGVRFGFLIDSESMSWSAGRIAPLADYELVVSRMRNYERVYGDWCYPPLVPVQSNRSETKVAPKMPAGFALPATHELLLTGGRAGAEAENFFIALFGMLNGLRLQREGWQHFYRTPVRPGVLCDFEAQKLEIAQALEIATRFWSTHADDSVRKQAFGALHWHLFAQLYTHDFERFNAQYMALDACWKLAQKTLPGCPNGAFSHAQRAVKLCELLSIPSPEWGDVLSQEKSSPLSVRRNALIHEAMYADYPVGFVYPTEFCNMESELTCLVARIFLRLLGIENEYTRSACTTRQTIGFSFA